MAKGRTLGIAGESGSGKQTVGLTLSSPFGAVLAGELAVWILRPSVGLEPEAVSEHAYFSSAELEPATDAPLPHWEAGDLVQLRAPSDPARPREYTVSSLPADGRLHLLVRQERHADGSLGCASGWLTAHAQVGELRRHSYAKVIDRLLPGKG